MTQTRTSLAAVGARIRRLRDSDGLNLHQLARLSGISAPALSLIENGKRDLRISSLYRIASALRVSASTLIEDEPNTSRDRNQDDRDKGYDLEDYT